MRIIRTDGEYAVSLEVGDSEQSALRVELDHGLVRVVSDQPEEPERFGLHERLEESFRLPEDADTARLTMLLERGTLEIHVPRRTMSASPRTVPTRRKALDYFNPEATPC